MEVKNLEGLEKHLTDTEARLATIDERIAALEGEETPQKIKEMSALLGEQRGIIDELARRRVAVSDPNTKRVVSEQAMREFGVRSLLDAPTKIRTSPSTESGFAVGFEPAEDVLGKFQEASDNLYLLGKVMNGSKDRDQHFDVTKSWYFKNHYLPAREAAKAMYKEAFDTSDSGLGSEWTGTYYSNRLFEMVRLEDALLTFYGSFNMPRSPFTAPVQLGDLTARTFAENTSHTGGTQVSVSPTTETVTGNTTWTAGGLALRAFTSRFMEEDSLIPFLPYLQAAVVQAIRNGLKKAIVNGDTTATHRDADINADALDAARRFIGLRKAANTSGAEVDAGGILLDTWANFAAIRSGRYALGKYGISPGNVGLMIGPAIFNQMLGVEAFATAASLVPGTGTNVQGDFRFSPFGLQLIVTEAIKENLAASGVNEGLGADTFTCAVLADRRGWLMGNLRQITVQMLRELYAEYDQDVALVTWRGDFQKIYGSSATTEAVVYDVKLT